MKALRPVLVPVLEMAFLLTACSGLPSAAQTTTPPPPTATATVPPTPTPPATFAHDPTPTATWVAQGPGHVQVPILLYHHIAVSPIGSRYYVTPDKFDAQLKLLRNWGYTSITTTMLVEAIEQGASLPPRPIIITFDDGNEDNYVNAFPAMQKYGFTGVLYIVSNRLQSAGYVNIGQIREMAAAGWEVGSHSVDHPINLNSMTPEQLRYEIVQSRKNLEAALNVPVLTFAYPFGDVGDAAIDYAHFAGYLAAMGATGFTPDQGKSNLFNLQRSEIQGSEDARTFIRFLPWLGDPSFLPTVTLTPSATATRTPKSTQTP